MISFTAWVVALVTGLLALLLFAPAVARFAGADSTDDMRQYALTLLASASLALAVGAAAALVGA